MDEGENRSSVAGAGPFDEWNKAIEAASAYVYANCLDHDDAVRVSAELLTELKTTGGEPRGKATSPSPSQAAVLAPDAEIAAQLRKIMAAYPLGTMDWPLDLMAKAAAALERRAVLVEALEKITRTPSMPFPDPGAHSWRAWGCAIHRAWMQTHDIARTALSRYRATPEKT